MTAANPRDPIAEARALGVSVLSQILNRTEDGLSVVDADRRWVYANPAACRMLGRPLADLRGRNVLDGLSDRDYATMLSRLEAPPGATPSMFAAPLLRADGAEREIVYSMIAVDVPGDIYTVTTFRDQTATRTAARTAAALAQTTAQLVGVASTDEILAGISRHVVDGTRALAAGISIVDADHDLASAGGYGRGVDQEQTNLTSARWVALGAGRGEQVVEAMTGGAIVIGAGSRPPMVAPNARRDWIANSTTKAFAATLKGLDWQAGVFLPLARENRVFGLLGIYLPAGLAGPSETELAYYAALADQAVVAVANDHLLAQAGQAATLLARTRLAHDLHDSVSQALFSMTMHARAAELSMNKGDSAATAPLRRSVTQLAELARGTLAEMRALIFELRPEALAEEGLVGALGKHGAAIAAREQVSVTVDGPEGRLPVNADVEEHLYRIVVEALHNVVKHATATQVAVTVTIEEDLVHLSVSDDGAGFDPTAERIGHLGLSTMAGRARDVNADFAITSRRGEGTVVSVAVSCTTDVPERAA